MTDVTLQSRGTGPLGAISKYFDPLPATNDLGAGIQASYGVVGYKGKVWSLRYRGEIKPIMRADGDGPVGSIEVIIIKAPTHLSKIYYETGYVEGSNAPPDCFSNNAVTPDPSSPKIQNNICGTCKWNAWGSRIIQQAGRTSQGKACSDSKRLAIVPLNDIDNEEYGGAMLLRVPPASLQDLAMFGATLAKYGYPYFAVGSRISFDPQMAHPQFKFTAIRALNDMEAQKILELQKSDAIDRILAETGSAAEAAEAVDTIQTTSPFEQDAPQQAQPQPVQPQPQPVQPRPETQAQPQPTAQPQPAQQAQPQVLQPSVGQANVAQPQPTPQTQEPEIRVNPENRQEQPMPSGWGNGGTPQPQQQAQPQTPTQPSPLEDELDAKLSGLLSP